MSPPYAMVLALIIAVVLIAVATRLRTSWPWYACAAIILAGCAYTYLKPEHFLAGLGTP